MKYENGSSMNGFRNKVKGKKEMGGSCSGHMGGKDSGVNIEKEPSYYTKGFVAGRKAGQK